MHIVITRDVFTDDATLSRSKVTYQDSSGNEVTTEKFFFCEDEDRGLESGMSDDEIAKLKVMSETAIPIGKYEVLFTYSPKYAETMERYGRTDGKMPQVLEVPGFKGIRIHSGNTEDHTAGCLLPGLHRDLPGESGGPRVTMSRHACRDLYQLITEAAARGQKVTLEIKRDMRAWNKYAGKAAEVKKATPKPAAKKSTRKSTRKPAAKTAGKETK